MRRFYATAALDPMRMSRDASRIADEIVQHLAGLVDTKVEVRIEVRAESTSGVEDSDEGECRFRRERERHSGPIANSVRSVATPALRFVLEPFASSRETVRSAAKGSAAAGKRVWGKRAAALVPAQRWRGPASVSSPSVCAAFLAHRVAAYVDAMGLVNQPVKDAVGCRGVTDLFVPAGHRKL